MSKLLQAVDTIVLVGGQGTRLQSVVRDRPKPLAEVAGRPFMEWLLLALRARGLQRVILATGYKGEMIKAYFGNGANIGLDILYAHEEAPLGTGGAVRNALLHTRTQHVMVLNGDSFCAIDVCRLMEAHKRTTAVVTLLVVKMDDCRRYGMVEVTDDGRVRSFREKNLALGTGLINAGVYLFDRGVFGEIPAGRVVSLEQECFPALIDHGLYATVGEGPFLDIGIPESYAVAEQFFANNRSLFVQTMEGGGR